MGTLPSIFRAGCRLYGSWGAYYDNRVVPHLNRFVYFTRCRIWIPSSFRPQNIKVWSFFVLLCLESRQKYVDRQMLPPVGLPRVGPSFTRFPPHPTLSLICITDYVSKPRGSSANFTSDCVSIWDQQYAVIAHCSRRSFWVSLVECV